jgi:hypothetical protein
MATGVTKKGKLRAGITLNTARFTVGLNEGSRPAGARVHEGGKFLITTHHNSSQFKKLPKPKSLLSKVILSTRYHSTTAYKRH